MTCDSGIANMSYVYAPPPALRGLPAVALLPVSAAACLPAELPLAHRAADAVDSGRSEEHERIAEAAAAGAAVTTSTQDLHPE